MQQCPARLRLHVPRSDASWDQQSNHRTCGAASGAEKHRFRDHPIRISEYRQGIPNPVVADA